MSANSFTEPLEHLVLLSLFRLTAPSLIINSSTTRVRLCERCVSNPPQGIAISTPSVVRTRQCKRLLRKVNLSPLIAFNGVQKVRVTGILFFDSEHSLGHHLVRRNNWEIHPILALEYCPRGKRCTAASDDNWVKLGEEP